VAVAVVLVFMIVLAVVAVMRARVCERKCDRLPQGMDGGCREASAAQSAIWSIQAKKCMTELALEGLVYMTISFEVEHRLLAEATL